MKTIYKYTKIIIIFFVSALSFNTAAGQGSGVLYTCNSANANHNIIRHSPNYGFVNISKPPTIGGMTLSLTDLSIMIDAHFSEDYDIHDMEIIDDTVYFCGIYVTGASGFLGWFAINELFFSPGSIHIDNTLAVYGLLSLDNIEVFRDLEGKIHVVGFGYYNSPNFQYYAFEAYGNPVTGMQYLVADLLNGGQNDDIKDLCVTDNFVVYLECKRNYPCRSFYGYGIKLKAFPKYSMLSSSYFTEGFFQTITNHYVYAGGCGHVIPDNSDPLGGESKMVHIGDDHVAVCSYRLDFDNTGWYPNNCDVMDCGFGDQLDTRYLAHRIYDISPVLSNQPMTMLSAAVAQLPGAVSQIDCFLYDNSRETYIVQHRLESSPGIWETAFSTIDFSSGSTPLSINADYQTMVNTTSGWQPESMCLCGGGDYVASGCDFMNLAHFFWRSNVSNGDGNCDIHQTYPVTIIPTMETKVNQFHISASGTQLEFRELLPDTKIDREISIKCE